MEYFQIGGFLIALYGAYNAWRANCRIDMQESLRIIPEIDTSAGNKMVSLKLKIQNPLSEVVRITRLDVSPPMFPQQVMDGMILPQPTPNPMSKINWDESIQPSEIATFVLYFDEEDKKLAEYSVKIHYKTSGGRKKATKHSFSPGYAIFI